MRSSSGMHSDLLLIKATRNSFFTSSMGPG
jgi:hypothetical protein